jgi:hypothetical protein
MEVVMNGPLVSHVRAGMDMKGALAQRSSAPVRGAEPVRDSAKAVLRKMGPQGTLWFSGVFVTLIAKIIFGSCQDTL